MPKNNYSIVVFFTFLFLLITFINSKSHYSYTPPSPVKSVSTKNHSSDHYQDVLDLQEAFVRNAKTLKPSVVSINKVREIIQESSWYNTESNNALSWFLKIKGWLSENLRGQKYAVESVGSGIVLVPRIGNT